MTDKASSSRMGSRNAASESVKLFNPRAPDFNLDQYLGLANLFFLSKMSENIL